MIYGIYLRKGLSPINLQGVKYKYSGMILYFDKLHLSKEHCCTKRAAVTENIKMTTGLPKRVFSSRKY